MIVNDVSSVKVAPHYTVLQRSVAYIPWIRRLHTYFTRTKLHKTDYVGIMFFPRVFLSSFATSQSLALSFVLQHLFLNLGLFCDRDSFFHQHI